MKNIANKVKTFLVSEDGPTAVEYGIMAALVGVVVITGATALGAQVNAVFNYITAALGGIMGGGS